MTTPAAFFQQAWEALQGRDQAPEFSFALGPHRVSVQVPSGPWGEALGAACGGDVATLDAEFHLRVFSAVELPDMPDLPVDLQKESVRGRIEEWCDERFLAVASLAGMTIADRESGRALVYYHSIESIPIWDLCAPFRLPLGFLGPPRGIHFLHAAAVAYNDQVVLLVGQGGSGKSSSALGCLAEQSPLRFLSEDYTVLTSSQKVVPLYRTAKVDGRGMERLPWLGKLRELGVQEGKHCLLIPAEISLAGGRLVGLVWPDRGTASPLGRLSPISALTKLAPSTLFQSPNSRAEDFRVLSQVCKSVPAFRLGLGDSPPPGVVTERLMEVFRAS